MTEPTYIQPAAIDHLAILDELKAMGWRDFKIETMCGFASGYVAQLRCKNVTNMAYYRAVRLHNFWVSERQALSNRVASVTT